MRVHCLHAGSEFPRLQASALLVRDAGMTAVLDCGERGGRPALLANLAALGVAASRVEALVLTHLHFDHCENADLFGSATLVVHWREVELLERLLREQTVEGIRACLTAHYEVLPPFYLRIIGRKLAAQREEYAGLLADRGRLFLVDGDAAFAGLQLVMTAGHSAGHLSVRVPGEPPVWFAGDAVATRREPTGPQAGPHLCWSSRHQREARQAMASRDGVLVPGHGSPFVISTGAPVRFEELS